MTPPARKILIRGEYSIEQPTSGGKAGKGCAVTSSIQVIQRHGFGSRLVANFRFVIADGKSRDRALLKARDFIDSKLGPPAKLVL
jgi:hypothetical protein